VFEFVFETHSNSYVVKRTSIKEIEDIFYVPIRLRITRDPENEKNSVEKKSWKNEFLHVISSSIYSI
jgi:hypothetical protein